MLKFLNEINDTTSLTFYFRIGEVIMETVRQKREYSAMYSTAQIPTNGGESGRDRLRRINNSRGEPQRQVDRQAIGNLLI